MTTRLMQILRVVEPKRVKAPYRAGIGVTNCGRVVVSSETVARFVRVELLESAT